MPIVRPSEIREMSRSDRQKKLRELQSELMRLRTMIKAGGSIDNPRRVREIKRAIARILTIEGEEERRR
ncbi:MAG: 50S ribosomal protein L29 [Candidatus Bathyarchaeia archaeon]